LTEQPSSFAVFKDAVVSDIPPDDGQPTDWVGETDPDLVDA